MKKTRYVCEICGASTDTLFKIMLEGSIVNVCPSCRVLGKEINVDKSKKERKQSFDIERSQDFEMVEEVMDNYGEIIKNKILEKYGDIKSFCKKYNISYNYLIGIIREDFKPTLEECKKFEKLLNVRLIVYEKREYFMENEEKENEKNFQSLQLGMFIKDERLKKLLNNDL